MTAKIRIICEPKKCSLPKFRKTEAFASFSLFVLRGRWPFLLRDAEAFASFTVFVLRTKAFAPSSRHFDQARAAGARRNPLLDAPFLSRFFLRLRRGPSAFFTAQSDANPVISTGAKRSGEIPSSTLRGLAGDSSTTLRSARNRRSPLGNDGEQPFFQRLPPTPAPANVKKTPVAG
jgi:hypothetical protein